MERASLIRDVEQRLDGRQVVWAGLRGDDVEALGDLGNLAASFSIIGRYTRRDLVASVAYEDLSGERPDLEVWDVDDHLEDEATADFRRGLLRVLAQPSALVAYRPSRFLSAIGFARMDRCLNLGLFGAHQAAFEHKPWVESSVGGLEIPQIPWTYVADEDQLHAKDLLADGPAVLRRSRTSGGEGIVRVDDGEELLRLWPRGAEAFVSVAPYLADAVPVNVGATVWDDAVTVHHPSVQLVGIPELVTRPFGYCGNDFAAGASLPDDVLDDVEKATRRIGGWLRQHGYLGTFGVDFLVVDGVPLFTEVNPRFQGSTHASCRLSVAAGESCLMLEHLAAMLHIPGPNGPTPPLRELARGSAPLSHLVVHHVGDGSQRIDPGPLVAGARAAMSVVAADVITRPELVTDRGAVTARLTVADQVTDTGFDLRAPWASIVGAEREAGSAGVESWGS